MKKIILSIAIIAITFSAYAQSESTFRTENQSEIKYYAEPESRNHPDGFMFQNGKLLMVKNGKISRVEKDTTLSNGTVIMSDGYYMKKDESKMMLKEGQHMDMSGKITPIDNSISNQELGNKTYQNGYLFQDGKLLKVKNGVMTPLEEDVKLVNGTHIMSDGHYMEPKELKMKFKEGEHMDMSGKIVQTNSSRKTDQHNILNKQNKRHPMPDSTKNNEY